MGELEPREMPSEIRKFRKYVVEELDGSPG